MTENFRLDRALFVLPDETARFTDFAAKDIDDIWIRRYKEYYCKQDPFELIKRKYHGKQTTRLEEVVDLPSFLRSEYYNEFLLPQKVHHKIISYLVSGKKTLGVIAFFRSRGSPNFSDEEAEMISKISSFIAHALDYITLQYKHRLQSSILDIIKDNGLRGLLILDDSMKPIFMNESARKICADIEERGAGWKGKGRPSVSPILMEDCRALKEARDKDPEEKPIPPIRRVVQIEKSRKRYALCSEIIDRHLCPEHDKLHVVSIDEVSDAVNTGREKLHETYGMTRREMDILSLLSRGLKNAEIARELFICEITVKKHIHRLFEKVGVKNRTALLHKTLIEPHDSL